MFRGCYNWSMKTNRERILAYLQDLDTRSNGRFSATTEQISGELGIRRCNVSTILNRLAEEKIVEKKEGRPVHYMIRHAEFSDESLSFSRLIGRDNSLKNAIQLAEAAILYPGNPLPILISGEQGTGKSFFAEMAYEFAKAHKVISESEGAKKIDCASYSDRDSQFSEDFDRNIGNNLLIDHLEKLNPIALEHLSDKIKQHNRRNLIICTLDTEDPAEQTQYLSGLFSVNIQMPSLKERSIEERKELVDFFLNTEACRMKMTLKANSELLYCLILYSAEGNVRQLENDIQIGCAKAYIRQYGRKDKQLALFVYDFPPYVRKGFLQWKTYQDKLTELIPRESDLTYSGTQIVLTKNGEKEKDQQNIYDLIESKEAILRKQGFSEEDIDAAISNDLSKDLHQVFQHVQSKELNHEVLSKMVDEKLIQMINVFLSNASNKFNRSYSNSTYYGLCLHLSMALKRREKTKRLPAQKVKDVLNSFPQESELSSNFLHEIENEYHTILSADEVTIITMIIARTEEQGDSHSPVLLIAMHGKSVASSIASVANELSMEKNAYSFDLPLDMSTELAYQKLRQRIVEINQGNGILLLYDMGSIRNLAQIVSDETGISIRFIQIPVTLAAMEFARKIDTFNNVDQAYDDLSERYREISNIQNENYHRSHKEKIILTICTTGQGGAQQIKNYLESNLSLDDIEIIPLSFSNRRKLLKEVDSIMKDHEILCVIGTFNPELYNIPFISIARIFETPVEKLGMLLSLDKEIKSTGINYQIVYGYIAEQLPNVNISKLKRTLPQLMKLIHQRTGGLSDGQEMGLFMHISCAISRLLNGEVIISSNDTNKIIEGNKKLYNDLRDAFMPLEKAFGIIINDDEITSVIRIIKQE